MNILSNTHLHLALSSLRRNRTRTFLSALGIAIGVASIVVIMSLTGGISRLINDDTDRQNANLILVRPSNNKNDTESLIDELTQNTKYQSSSLTMADLEEIKNTPNVQSAAPIASIQSSITLGDKPIPSVNLVATTADLAKTTSLPLKDGNFLSNKKASNTAVIGSSLANRIFGHTDVLTNVLSYNGQKFIIVGVLEKLDNPINYNGIDFDNSLIVDANYVTKLDSPIQIQQLNVRAKTTNAVPSVVEEIKHRLSASKNGDTSFKISTGSEGFKSESSLFTTISGMLTLVAFISLFIGGIGIMNIMLVSVSERTREIGIRKAVGATSGNILLQFLLESIILSLTGGIMGIVMGYLGAFAISLATPFRPFISFNIILLTAITSFATGIIFGLYPAAKAAHKEPIASLKEYH